MTAIRFVGATCLVLLCGGCGGGGGGGGGGGPTTATPVANFQTLPVGINATLRNPTNTQTMDAFSTIAADPATGIRPLQQSEGGQMSVTFSPSVSNPSGTFRITTTIASSSSGVNGSQTFTTGSGLSNVVTVDANMDIVAIVTLNGTVAENALLTNVLTSTRPNLSYQLFGVWASSTTSPNDGIGVFSVGNIVTPATSVPTTGTSSYSGTLLGTADTNVNSTSTDTFRYLTATVNANVDFANRSMAFSTSNTRLRAEFTSSGDPAPSYDLAGTLSWDAGSNVFRGNVSNGALTGPARGRFYGPNAEELGGVLHANDGTRQLMGAFGAAR